MSKWCGGVLTAKGQEIQAKAEAAETILDFTCLKLGDGKESIDDVDDMLDLVSPKYTMPISSRSARNNVCTITGIVQTTEISDGFIAREMGIFARDPEDGSEFLYMISIDDRPDPVFPEIESSYESIAYALMIITANCSNIKIEIDPNALVTVDMLKRATNTVGRSTSYKAGDIISSDQLAPGTVLQCIKGGITSELEINGLKDLQLDTRYQDGEVLWAVVRLITSSEDQFYKDDKGNIKLKPQIYDPCEPVKFIKTYDGRVIPAGREFYSYLFMYNERGNIVARPDDWQNHIPDIPDVPVPDNPDDEEADENTAGEQEAHDIFQQLLEKLNQEAQQN